MPGGRCAAFLLLLALAVQPGRAVTAIFLWQLVVQGARPGHSVRLAVVLVFGIHVALGLLVVRRALLVFALLVFLTGQRVEVEIIQQFPQMVRKRRLVIDHVSQGVE